MVGLLEGKVGPLPAAAGGADNAGGGWGGRGTAGPTACCWGLAGRVGGSCVGAGQRWARCLLRGLARGRVAVLGAERGMACRMGAAAGEGVGEAERVCGCWWHCRHGTGWAAGGRQAGSRGVLKWGGLPAHADVARPVLPISAQTVPQGDLRGVSYEDSKYLGGDVAHTHLVKGLDFALLQKVGLWFD